MAELIEMLIAADGITHVCGPDGRQQPQRYSTDWLSIRPHLNRAKKLALGYAPGSTPGRYGHVGADRMEAGKGASDYA